MTRAIRFSRTGGPEVLELEQIALPEPKSGQALVRHHAIGVNFIDTYHRSGLYPVPLPSGLGSEAAGVWLRHAFASAECVAVIGNVGWILAKASLLDGHEVATGPELAREIGELCPSARPNSRAALCTSGKLLSARASALGLDLSCEIVARCFGKKLASGLSASLGIDWSGELGALDIVPGPLLVK